MKTIGLVAIVKNESRYVLEWVAYYRVIGISDIIIYNNESDDEGREILDKLADCGFISLNQWSSVEGVSPQLSAYMDAIKRYGSTFSFLAFFDADEFLVQNDDIDLATFLNGLDENVSAVAINQKTFGTSGHEKYEPGLVVERFTKASIKEAPDSRWSKVIARPEKVSGFLSPHRARLKEGRNILTNGCDAFASEGTSGEVVGTDQSKFQLNHYITKSVQEFMDKRARGGGAGSTKAARLKRNEDMTFFEYRNGLYSQSIDETLANRAAEIREEMKKITGRIS